MTELIRMYAEDDCFDGWFLDDTCEDNEDEDD
jgi:hypothetical protein